MGQLIYGSPGRAIEIDDDALAHLKLVATTKLRRGESFTFSWVNPAGEGPGRSTIWLHPAIPLTFEFDDAQPAKLSAQWLEELAQSSHSTGGIRMDLSQLPPRDSSS